MWKVKVGQTNSLLFHLEVAKTTDVPCDLKEVGSIDNNHENVDGSNVYENDDVEVLSVNESYNKLVFSTFKESFYHYYCGELIRNGTFKWRVNTTHKKVVLMNDCDSDSGNFLVSDI